MKDKKADIIKAAKKLFAEKGYLNVSMQAIAEECKISKASIYKIFQSKEELLLALINFRKEEMLKKSAKINTESSLTPKERFAKKIALEIMEFRENRQFINFMSNDGASPDTALIRKHLKQTKSMIISWHRDSIIQAYGEEVKPYIWELVIIYHGLMREFLFLVAAKKSQPHVESIPPFIMSLLDLYIEKKQTGEMKPSLNEDIIASYMNMAIPHPPKKEELLAGHLQTLKDAIRSLSNDDFDVKELQSAAGMLCQEMFEEEPRPFLIQALLDYLGKIETLEQTIAQIKTIYTKE
ncbi:MULTISPECIES: TetR/AcrR family transcriptional regulator [Bacillus]|uniref:TetR/AcrR family transcriptional regulator n=1 Tax=Bacillus TaxID=1386 RepID=UPI000479A0B7|nr:MULTISPECIES: TetR/AcrR family transcriptional regulator [Bacillus]WFA05770.1 TetR/AcrR family transcriptional regulator [Bacillus sp. HSf4]